MIQRIQTVFLFLAIVCLGLFLWLPLISVEGKHFFDSQQGWTIGHTLPVGEQPYIIFFNLIFVATAIGFSLLAIVLFKKRSLQMLLCWFAIILIVTAQAFVFYKYQTKIFLGDVILRKYNLLSILAIGFEIAAFYFIRKDEETIKSLDRLR
jgi:uncharacterized membrane protein